MKICFVINKYDFFYTHRFALAKKFTSFSEVSVLTDLDNADKKIIEKISKSDISLYSIPKRSSRKGMAGFFIYLARLRNAIKKIEPDMVFFVTLEISLIGAIISWFNTRINSYYLITGYGPYFFKTNIKNKIFYVVSKYIFVSSAKKFNSKFIFQNTDDKNIFLNNGFASEKNILLIHGSGIDTEEIKFIQRHGSQSISFLFASRLVKSKGIIEYIEAGKIIKQIYPEVTLNIAGKYDILDSDKISNELFLEIQNSDIFNYLGNIDHDSIYDHLLNSDIFILPSHGEGIPKAALEAAASGMPLILSDASGCKECIQGKENGLLVKMMSVESVKHAMETIILNPELVAEMGSASRKLIENKFSINNIANQYKKELMS